MPLEALPEKGRIKASVNTSVGMPIVFNTGAKNLLITSIAPEALNMPMATIMPTK